MADAHDAKQTLPRGNKPTKKRLVFTDAWLRGLKASGKRVVYSDIGERGLVVRVGPTGTPTLLRGRRDRV